MIVPEIFGPAAFTTFGDFLRYLRRRVRKTLHELAQSVGYSEAHLSRIERGERLPPDRTALVTWFIPALELEREPELVARLVELAAMTRGEQLADSSISLSHTTRQELTATIETPLASQPPTGAAISGRPSLLPYAALTAGLAGLPGSPLSSVEQFLHEYLGTAEAPAPFGGREAELAQLNRWLADPSQPVALLVAAAGQGKSALLAHWSMQVAEQGRAAVAFLPISIRFDTARVSTSMSLLGARLRHLHGVVADPPRDPVTWLTEIDQYVRADRSDATPLVLVLDGVDEAIGWMCGRDLRFPPRLGHGVKVLVSARALVDCDAAGWQRRLEWEGIGVQLSLPPLDRRGVGAVLRALDAPHRSLAAPIDLADELYRLSSGDPLLVRLYVEALRVDGHVTALQQDELPQVPPGLATYFERWWDAQRRQWGADTPLREPAVRALLSLLACALGPLTGDDLLALTAPEGLDSWTVAEALQPLGRFVVGDGLRQGYVFSHPRLGQYFYEKLTDRERAAWEHRLLDYGEQTLHALDSGRIAPRAASRYAVQYYGAHLDRAGPASEQFYALVSQGWLRAWEALEGTYDGFLADLGRAWRRAEADGVGARGRAIGLQYRYALIHASINSLGESISPAMLVALVEQRIWTVSQAFAYACRMPYEHWRAEGLVKLAPHLSETLLREALAIAESLIDEGYRTQALMHLGVRLALLGYSEEALAITRKIPTKIGQAQALASIAPYLQDTESSEILAEALADKYKRVQVLNELVSKLPAPLLYDALTAAREIATASDRARVLAGLVPYVLAIERSRVLNEALAATRAIEDLGDRVRMLTELVSSLPEAERSSILEEALAATRAIEDKERRARVLAELVRSLSDVERPTIVAEVLATARTIDDIARRASVLANLVRRLPDAERPAIVAEALATVQMVDNAEVQGQTLAKLAPFLSETSLLAAITTAQAIERLHWRDHALRSLVPQLVTFDRIEEARALAEAIESPIERHGVQRHLAIHFAKSGSPEAALAIMSKLEGSWGSVVAYLPEALLSKVLGMVSALKERPNQQFRALKGLVAYLPEARLHEAVALAQAIEQPVYRTNALVSLAPRLPAALLREVLVVIQAIGDADNQASAISFIDSDPERLAMTLQLEEQNDIWCQAPELSTASDVASALAAAQTIEDVFPTRAMRVTQLAARLVELGEPYAALAAVQELPSQDWTDRNPRAAGLAHLVLYLGLHGYTDLALATAQALDETYWRAEALAGLTPLLPEDARRGVLKEALNAARAIEPPLRGFGGPVEDWATYMDDDGTAPVRALARLAAYLPAAERLPLLVEARSATLALRMSAAPDFAQAGLAVQMARLGFTVEALEVARVVKRAVLRDLALVGMMPNLPEVDRPAVFAEVLANLKDTYEGLSVALPLVRHLQEVPREHWYPLWCELVHVLAISCRRSGLLGIISNIRQVMTELGGQEALAEAKQAILDVGRWFP
jgi:transcriptional regulator with XRE-family HTH domain